MAPHLLFNIHTKDEWDNYLVPKLRMLIPDEDGYLIIIGGDKYPITQLSLNEDDYEVTWIEDGEEMVENFVDFYLLDEEDRILPEKSQYLKDLYDEIFNT